MKTLKGIAKGRFGFVFLSLLLAVKVGLATESDPSQDSLGSEVYPMEICNNIWMYNDKDYWIEIHDFIPCPDSVLIWPEGDSDREPRHLGLTKLKKKEYILTERRI